MREPSCELNLDGLVGPTHSYAGLSYGNLASGANKQAVSHPKEAALQGLRKMKLLADLGVKQGVLPPHERPDVDALRRLGFAGTDARVLETAGREDPSIFAACCSASAMWAANAATVSPSADTADGRVHFTPANLVSQFHRSLEAQTTGVALRAIFRDETCFVHHAPLPASTPFADEGAANHTRLCTDYGRRGLELFVYGRSALAANEALPRRFPARQTREAADAVARLHGLRDSEVLMVRQNPVAIDAGAFHNDVVAVGNLGVFLFHTAAFADEQTVDRLRTAFTAATGGELAAIEVTEAEVPLADAIECYLFNSQLVRLPDDTILLLAPMESAESPTARPFLDSLPSAAGPINAVRYIDVRQSMRNGGGPACLRLRVALTERELSRIHPGILLTPSVYVELTAWVERHYRDQLCNQDLADPKLLDETRAALDHLTQILSLGPIYRFQGGGSTGPR